MMNFIRKARMLLKKEKKQSIFPFQTLPYEIRYLIYLAAGPHKDDLIVDICTCQNKPGKLCLEWSKCWARSAHNVLPDPIPTSPLLLLNRQIYDEACELLDCRRTLSFCTLSCLDNELGTYSLSQRRSIKAFHVHLEMFTSEQFQAVLRGGLKKPKITNEEIIEKYHKIFGVRGGYGDFRLEPTHITVDDKGHMTCADLTVHVGEAGTTTPKV